MSMHPHSVMIASMQEDFEKSVSPESLVIQKTKTFLEGRKEKLEQAQTQYSNTKTGLAITAEIILVNNSLSALSLQPPEYDQVIEYLTEVRDKYIPMLPEEIAANTDGTMTPQLEEHYERIEIDQIIEELRTVENG